MHYTNRKKWSHDLKKLKYIQIHKFNLKFKQWLLLTIQANYIIYIVRLQKLSFHLLFFYFKFSTINNTQLYINIVIIIFVWKSFTIKYHKK